jgi:dephospho-CoA kinase
VSLEAAASRHRAVRIGITGPIGCGKSTIARWLGERPGVLVIDADQVARNVRADPEVARRITERFGSDDPTVLARTVFADEGAMRDLETLVHPAVRSRILAAIDRADAAGAGAVIIEAIKLVEGGLAALCDEVWLVTCEPGIQRARLVARGSPAADADRRITAQGDIVGRLRPGATRTIDTSGELERSLTRAGEILDAALEGRVRS